MIKSITFDVARTLMGLSETVDWGIVSDFLVDQGMDLYPQELQAAREYVFMVDLPRYGLKNWEEWTRQILKRLDYPDVDTSLITEMIEHLTPSVNSYYLFDDVIPLFLNLDSYNLSYSALTTIPEFKLKKVLEPIRGHLHHITHGGNAQCVKGNPKMYNLDLTWKKVLPEENLFIGDHPHLDIAIPKSMGQKTVHIRRAGIIPEKEGSGRADYSVTSLSEIPDIIDRILSN